MHVIAIEFNAHEFSTLVKTINSFLEKKLNNFMDFVFCRQCAAFRLTQWAELPFSLRCICESK